MEAEHYPRPYFWPADLDYETLPISARAAVEALVVPLYRELVVGSRDPLDRAAGSTVVFLQLLEIIDQTALGESARDFTRVNPEDHVRRSQALRTHLALVGAKQRTIDSLVRVRKHLAQANMDQANVRDTQPPPPAENAKDSASP